MKIAVTILLSILTLVTSAQSDQEIITRIKHAYYKDSLDYVKKASEDFLKTRPTSSYTIAAKYFLADIAYVNKDYSLAINYYKQIISIFIPDSLDDNYRNIALKQLAEFYIAQKQYKEAIKYLNLTKKFPYKTTCANGSAEDNIRMTDLYSECYIAEGKFKKAINILTPYMFNAGLEDNSILVKKLYSTYVKIYSKEEIKRQFINAENTLEIKKLKYNNKLYVQPTIKIFDSKVWVPLSWCLDESIEYSADKENDQKQKSKDIIKTSAIYELATN